MTRKNVFYLLFSLVLLTACSGNPLDIDASGVQVDIEFTDVNKAIMYTDSTELLMSHASYKEQFPEIYDYFTGYCMGIGKVQDSAFYNSIVAFREDTTIQKLAEHLKDNFADKKLREEKITDGFRHLKFHLPSTKVPQNIIWINSLFRNGAFSTESEMSIGMEQYLGKDNEIIRLLPSQVYFDWMKEGMDAQFLERDVLTGWIETHCVDALEGNLAENIVRWGKILYLTEAAFPKVEQHVILRYSKEDLDWALENEYAFWKYLIDEELLFTTDERTVRNMIGDGPFTPGIPEDGSPDRMGQFLGWRMVHMYMENNDVTVEEMVGTTYNDILQDFEVE